MIAKTRNLLELSGKLTYFKTKQLLDSPDSPTNPLQKKLIKKLKRDGYAVLPAYYSKKQCKELIEEVERIIKQYKDEYFYDSDGTDIRIYDANRVSNKIKKYRNDPFLKAIGEHYKNSRLLCIHTLAGKLFPLPSVKNMVKHRRWHRDNSFIPQYKAMIYLNDVKEENGAFWYFPGTHTVKNLYKEVLHYRNPKKVGIDYDFSVKDMEKISKIEGRKHVVLGGKAGDIVLFDSRGLHRGPPIKKGKRYTLTNYYMQKNLMGPKLKAFWNKMYKIKKPVLE